MTLVAATLTIHPNEPAYELAELNRLTPDKKAWHRYQRISVVRNEEIVVWERDMGPADAYSVRQFRIVGGQVHTDGRGEAWETVASIQDTADQMRLEQRHDEWDDLPGWTAEQYLQAYDDERDRRNRIIAGRKTYGELPKGKR